MLAITNHLAIVRTATEVLGVSVDNGREATLGLKERPSVGHRSHAPRDAFQLQQDRLTPGETKADPSDD